MKAVLQLVSNASVCVEGSIVGEIDSGLLVLLGVAKEDTEKDAKILAEKIIHLRIFPDDKQRMNRSIKDTGGAMLIISQFTLFANCRKGRRPSYSSAAPPDKAKKLYDFFHQYVVSLGVPVETGEFQALMEVHLVNQGPVTIELDTTTLSISG